MADLKGDVKARDGEYGWTPLHYAVDRGWPHLVQDLLARGADPNAKDDSGFTPLHVAAGCETFEAEPARFGPKHGSDQLIAMLVRAGAKTDAQDAKGRTPLWWAEKLERRDAVNALKGK